MSSIREERQPSESVIEIIQGLMGSMGLFSEEEVGEVEDLIVELHSLANEHEGNVRSIDIYN